MPGTKVKRGGWEGLVAKDEASPYVGGRTRDWLKVEQANWTGGEHRWRRPLSVS
jgi:ATP-dependent DNA ligase